MGQALEAREISVFELTRLSEHYIIRGVPEQSGSLRSKVGRWLRLGSSSSAESLTFTVADIEKLSQAGLARRFKPGQLTNFRSLSNLLRTIGAYLDSKEAELFELKKRPISLSLCYRDKAGREQREDHTISHSTTSSLSFGESESRRNKRRYHETKSEDSSFDFRLRSGVSL